MKNAPANKEVHAIGDAENLQKLGGVRRIRESTIDAAGNILGGAGRLVFTKGERFKGAAQMGQGVLDVLDIVPSAAADANRFVWGPKETETGAGPSEFNYNISRAVGGAKDVKNPLAAIGVAGDIIHAAGFKLGSDALKAIRQKNMLGGGSVGAQQASVRKNIARLDDASYAHAA